MTIDEKKEKKRLYMIEWRKKNPDYFNDYQKEIYANNKDEINERRRKNPNSLWSILKRNARKRLISFSLTKDEFSSWWYAQEQACAYCDIPIARLSIVNKSKKMAKRLSIDRVDNDAGYSTNNIVLSCMMCNFIKSNLFTFREMREIGQKYIKPKWQL